MSRAIDTVLFDLDDTLHDDSRAYRSATGDVARDIAARHGIDPEALVAAYVKEVNTFWRSLSVEHLTTRIPENRRMMWASALAALGIDDPSAIDDAAERYAKYRKRHLVPFPGAVDLLNRLRARGVKTGLITNGFSYTHREKLVLLGFEQLFDAVVIADEVGMVKPDPAMFRHALTLLKSDAAASAMVGDRYFRDIAGAREAGIFTVYLATHGESIPPEAPPDATVQRIEDVERVIPFAKTLRA